MTNALAIPCLARFGTFEVNFQSREIRKHGMRIRMEEKPFQILELLLLSAGHVVTRKTLRERLWPDTIVGFDHGLNTAVNKLRDLLGDSARNPRFIETLPRLGYRFIAPVVKPGRAAGQEDKRMLLVLPFKSLCGDDEQKFFAEGLTEETITQLGQINPKRLGVISGASALRYKATEKPIAEIAAELRVDCVLEGSVRCNGQRVRITGQLIEARDRTNLWSGTFDRDLRNTLEVQADVARQIGKAVAPELLND